MPTPWTSPTRCSAPPCRQSEIPARAVGKLRRTPAPISRRLAAEGGLAASRMVALAQQPKGRSVRRGWRGCPRNEPLSRFLTRKLRRRRRRHCGGQPQSEMIVIRSSQWPCRAGRQPEAVPAHSSAPPFLSGPPGSQHPARTGTRSNPLPLLSGDRVRRCPDPLIDRWNGPGPITSGADYSLYVAFTASDQGTSDRGCLVGFVTQSSIKPVRSIALPFEGQPHLHGGPGRSRGGPSSPGEDQERLASLFGEHGR